MYLYRGLVVKFIFSNVYTLFPYLEHLQRFLFPISNIKKAAHIGIEGLFCCSNSIPIPTPFIGDHKKSTHLPSNKRGIYNPPPQYTGAQPNNY